MSNISITEVTIRVPGEERPELSKIWAGLELRSRWDIPKQDYLEPGEWSKMTTPFGTYDPRGRKVIVIPTKFYFTNDLVPELQEKDFDGVDNNGTYRNVSIILHQRYADEDLWVLSRPQSTGFESGYIPKVHLIKMLLEGRTILDVQKYSHYKMYVIERGGK